LDRSKRINVSIVVTCFNEEENIGDCLESLIHQSYPEALYEIIVSDGGSRDGTQEVVRSFQERDKRIKLVIELKKGTAAGRNAGIKSAAYDWIAFIDADCEAPADWLATLVSAWEKATRHYPDLAGVGGANIPPRAKGSRFLTALGIAQNSYLGSLGSVQGSIYPENRLVGSISTCNALYRKNHLINSGLFDESLKSEAEDAELNYRISRNGGSFLFVHDSYVIHKMRISPGLWAKNMFRYGKGRARLMKRYPEMFFSPYILALLFLPVIAASGLGFLNAWFYLPLAYFPAIILAAAARVLKEGRITFLFPVIQVYLITHFSYSPGLVYGLINPKVR